MRKVWDKLLFVLFALIIIVLCVGALGIAWKMIPFDGFSDALYDDIRIPILITAGSTLILLILIRLLVAVFSRPLERSILLRVTQNGIVRVSLDTLDDLTQKHARSITYVRDVKSRIVPVKESIRIFLKLSLTPEADIPAVTSSLQESMKEYITRYSGVPVLDVQVYVENTSINLKARAS
ncbi:MAG: alkaline shock response membrane anchor protein AmaP [Christensenellales bacterium]